MSFRFATDETRARVERYLDLLRRSHPRYTFGLDLTGQKYARVWKQESPNVPDRSVVVFIDAYGELYKADSWKKVGRRLHRHVFDLEGKGRIDRDRRRSSGGKWTVICSDGGRKPDWWNFPTEREAHAFAKDLRATGYREVKVVNKSGSARDVFLAPQGAMFDRVDSKGRTHRFRVARSGYNMVDLAHVATWDPASNRWERGEGTLYPVTRRELATMRRAPVRDRRRGRPLGRRARRDQEYEAETLGGWQKEHGGWGERRKMTEEERRSRHREYELSSQSQGEQGAAYDQRRPRRLRRRRR